MQQIHRNSMHILKANIRQHKGRQVCVSPLPQSGTAHGAVMAEYPMDGNSLTKGSPERCRSVQPAPSEAMPFINWLVFFTQGTFHGKQGTLNT